MHTFDRQTDRETGRNLIVRPRLHSMQRGKNMEIWFRRNNKKAFDGVMRYLHIVYYKK